LRHLLVRHGVVGGGTDFRRWHRQLARLGYVRIADHPSDEILSWAPPLGLPDTDLVACRARISALLRGRRRAQG
jgi:hypothetical protein